MCYNNKTLMIVYLPQHLLLSILITDLISKLNEITILTLELILIIVLANLELLSLSFIALLITQV